MFPVISPSEAHFALARTFFACPIGHATGRDEIKFARA